MGSQKRTGPATALPAAIAKEEALSLVARKGYTVAAAMKAVGRAEKTWAHWRRDPEFAELADLALNERTPRPPQAHSEAHARVARDNPAWDPPRVFEPVNPAPREPAADLAPPAPTVTPCPLCSAPLVVTPRATLRCLSASCGREVPA